MERFIRFAISLFLSGMMVFTGLGLILYSLVNFHSTYKIMATMPGEKEAGASLALLLADSLADAMEQPELFLQPPILWLWLLFPALLLIGFGIRRMARRLIDGVPLQQIQRPTSGPALWGTTVAFVLGLLLTGPSFISGVIKAPKSIPAIFFGVDVQAQTVAVWEEDTNRTDGEKEYYARFFFPAAGMEHQAELQVRRSRFDWLRKLPTVRLTYVRGNPDEIYLTNDIPGRLSYAWSFVWRFALLYVAVCGLLRNFLPKRSLHTGTVIAPDLHASGNPIPSASPQNRAVGSGRQRKQFGTRGPT